MGIVVGWNGDEIRETSRRWEEFAPNLKIWATVLHLGDNHHGEGNGRWRGIRWGRWLAEQTETLEIRMLILTRGYFFSVEVWPLCHTLKMEVVKKGNGKSNYMTRNMAGGAGSDTSEMNRPILWKRFHSAFGSSSILARRDSIRHGLHTSDIRIPILIPLGVILHALHPSAHILYKGLFIRLLT